MKSLIEGECKKVQYTTNKRARQALKKLKFKSKGVSYYYRCPLCPHKVYHLTSRSTDEKGHSRERRKIINTDKKEKP